MKWARSPMAVAVSLFVGAVVPAAVHDELDPASLVKPLSDSWPTYYGDYSGRRYSALAQIAQSNVRNLTLAWVSRLAAGSGGGAGFGSGSIARTIVGGEGSGEIAASGPVAVKGAILEVS